MSKLRAVLGVVLLFVSMINVGHAAIVRYELSGSWYFADADWKNIRLEPMSGELYASDINLIDYTPNGNVYFEIPSFVIRTNGYEWSGSGYFYGGSDRNVYLNGGDWSYRSGLVGQGWFELPEELLWPGQGWIFEEGYMHKLHSMHMQMVSSVPVPAAVWLFCSGIVGLLGLQGGLRSKQPNNQALPLA